MVRKNGTMVCVAVVAILAGLYVNHAAVVQAQDEAQEMTPMFELRTYTAVAGKTQAMLDRFRQGERAMLGKNGMRPIGFWVPADPPLSRNTLIYILEHRSLDASKDSWDRFAGDPVWRTLRDRTTADGPLVSHVESVFMSPQAALAKAREAEPQASAGVFDFRTFADPRSRASQAAAAEVKEEEAEGQQGSPMLELRTYTAADGRLEALLETIRLGQGAMLGDDGVRVIGSWVPVDPPLSEDTVIYLLEHESLDAAKDSWDRGRSAADGSLVRNVESVFMNRTDFSPAS